MSIEDRIEKAWNADELVPEQHSGTSFTDFRAGYLAAITDRQPREIQKDDLENDLTYWIYSESRPILNVGTFSGLAAFFAPSDAKFYEAFHPVTQESRR